ncbi:MAG: HupE/UreJ family protein [Methylomonas sp.]|jgi:hydrogenase/urease accessory protein HupE|uniref:HupE/UreJ family protein n=1 Tax=Methylomonas sp. TaxID=418 RepID=UPI0025F1684E|nr:HupE/UreJ family protein [Methylomonas sp.]MCK9607697.1 HupE/UreJ family protein [Methylomonas sp.]
MGVSGGIARSFAFLLLLLVASGGWAHPPGLSSIYLQVERHDIAARMTFALQDIEAFAPMDSDLDAEVTDVERDAAKPSIAKLLSRQLKLSLDGQAIEPSEPGKVNFDEQNNAHVDFHFGLPDNGGRQLSLQSEFLVLLPEGHQQQLTVKNADNQVIAEVMLSREHPDLKLDLQSTQLPSAFTTFAGFFKLGVEHIVTGYDHLLFLFGLLMVTHSFWPAIKIITFFTIAHSITLALAGLNIIELPSSFVEPFIAATIMYVGVENIIRGDHPKGRHWLTFGFGLIHGFGFASVLREMEIGNADFGILLPLLSFNLGIETGQIAVASIVLPLIWALNNRVETSRKFLTACSGAISLMGAYWLIERTLL